MRTLLVAILLAASSTAHADPRDLCTGRYRGTTIDFDMKHADIHAVFRMLADVGKVNIVVGDTVQGKVTMKLKRVPWDQVACTIAAMHQLTITVDGNILLVRPVMTSARAAGRLRRTTATRS